MTESEIVVPRSAPLRIESILQTHYAIDELRMRAQRAWNAPLYEIDVARRRRGTKAARSL